MSPNSLLSFASAAAGSNGRNEAPGARGSGSGECSRSNGTRTFRRPSTALFSSSMTPNAAESANAIHSDTLSSLNPQTAITEDTSPLRYSRDQLLLIAQELTSSGNFPDVKHLLSPDFTPAEVNGASARLWGRSGETGYVPLNPYACWEKKDNIKPPVGKEVTCPELQLVMLADVKSATKMPAQNRDSNALVGTGPNGRKLSTSHGFKNFGLASPSSSRPGTRRRETTDMNALSADLTSPRGGGLFPGDERSSWFNHKNQNSKDAPESDEDTVQPRDPTPFGGLQRANTSGSAFGPTASLWGATVPSSGATLPSAGSFGSFSMAGSGLGLGPSTGGGLRPAGGSRLAHLIPKDGNGDGGANKANGAGNQAEPSLPWPSRQRTDTDSFTGDDGSMTGSFPGDMQDSGSQSLHVASQNQRARVADTPVKGLAGNFGMSGLGLGGGNEPNDLFGSPDTNPYRSPTTERNENDGFDRYGDGEGDHQATNPSSLSRPFGSHALEGSDRSQTSSVGAKAYTAFNANLLGAWPQSATPDRERQQAFSSAFGPHNMFSSVADPQPSAQAGFAGLYGAGIGQGGGALRSATNGSRLGSLFPAVMQAQMHGQDQEGLADSEPDVRQPLNKLGLGAIGRGSLGVQVRDTEGPMRAARTGFEEAFSRPERSRSPLTSGDHGPSTLATTTQAPSFPTSATSLSFAGPAAPSDPAPVHQYTMVMPDRMHWIYLDPQGALQGPFTGLEMHDWYKAQFFTPNLRVKRVEDPEFEPLGQLIRRIGNSREPFLVPQMGIPHGDPPERNASVGEPTGSNVPPLSGAFPAYGRTLTADEQNNLERRKQEEQFAMARQREYFASQQSRILPLHHHPSGGSLHSQPSFGSLTSPIPTVQPLGTFGTSAGFFSPQGTMAPAQPPIGAAPINAVNIAGLNSEEREFMMAQMQASGVMTGSRIYSPQPIGAPGPSSLGVRSQVPRADQLEQDLDGFEARLKEFNEIRAQRDAEATTTATEAKTCQQQKSQQPFGTPQPTNKAGETREEPAQAAAKRPANQMLQQLSLTQQVRKTQADKAAAAAAGPASNLPTPFPPPAQSSTPLPAPTAQRARSNLPSQYGDRSASSTPDTVSDVAAVDPPPPPAPWAGAEAQKGPSLREIQEVEAKKAAKAEQLATQERRLAAEQDSMLTREREKQNAALAASGLATSSTWGTVSPVDVGATTGAGSAWAKSSAGVKGASGSGVSGSAGQAHKPTLADIQREEERRKQRLATQQQSMALSMGNAAAAYGKRYADLASKGPLVAGGPGLAGAASSALNGGGWLTVGAGGKVRVPSSTPTGPASQMPPRAAAAAVKTPPMPTLQPQAKRPVQTVPSKNTSPGAAMEEFNKWAQIELTKGLDKGVNINDFLGTLHSLPDDMIADSVYQCSTTMDGRHFEAEYIRRKKLADKGIVEKVQSTSGPGDPQNAGWSEVAKGKGSSNNSAPATAAEPAAPHAMKVVMGRKKSKK